MFYFLHVHSTSWNLFFWGKDQKVFGCNHFLCLILYFEQRKTSMIYSLEYLLVWPSFQEHHFLHSNLMHVEYYQVTENSSSFVFFKQTSLINSSVWPGATASADFFFNACWVLKNFCLRFSFVYSLKSGTFFLIWKSNGLLPTVAERLVH